VFTSIGFSIGYGPIGWILSTELFPPIIRGRAMAISLITRNLLEFITSFSFLPLSRIIHFYGVFFVLFIFNLIALLFTRLCMVESKEIEPSLILNKLMSLKMWSGSNRDNESDDSKLLQVAMDS
jgi:MFS family permease